MTRGRAQLRVLRSWAVEDLWMLIQHLLINRIGGSWLTPRLLRHAAYRCAGIRSHSANVFPEMTVIGKASNLCIGGRSYLNAQVFLDCSGEVRIGEDCLIGQRSMILTSHHPTGRDGRPQKTPIARDITIGDRVWIGAAAVVLPGVTIGDDVVVAAGSVVTRDCAPAGVYAGVPARRLKELDVRQETASGS